MEASQIQHGEPRRLVMSAPTPLRQDFDASQLPARCGSSLQRNDADVWLCEYPGLSFQRSPVCACSLVSSLLLSGATMSQQHSLTQSAHSVSLVLTAYTPSFSAINTL